MVAGSGSSALPTATPLKSMLGAILYAWQSMYSRRTFRLVLGLGGALLTLFLIVWVAVLLSSTRITIGPDGGASSETTLGNLKCHKELKATPPFFALTCQEPDR